MGRDWMSALPHKQRYAGSNPAPATNEGAKMTGFIIIGVVVVALLGLGIRELIHIRHELQH